MTDWKTKRDAAADKEQLNADGSIGYCQEYFKAGADWARAEAQAEIELLKKQAGSKLPDYLHEIVMQDNEKLRVEIERLSALTKDHEDDWKRIQDAERERVQLRAEVARLKDEKDELRSHYETRKRMDGHRAMSKDRKEIFFGDEALTKGRGVHDIGAVNELKACKDRNERLKAAVLRSSEAMIDLRRIMTTLQDGLDPVITMDTRQCLEMLDHAVEIIDVHKFDLKDLGLLE
ncbi:MAG: hypothetical protein HC883_00325 [Bdellovibrionaceae bacterium]|nr:hypothetical protein [Pseudobdellovibrionaceae bacterium]